jgi:hypothetical protein
MKKSIIYVSVGAILLFLIILIVSLFLNRQTPVIFNIKPFGKYKLIVNKIEYTITASKTINLSPGKYKIIVKADGYDDYSNEINVKRSGENEFLIDMSKNKIQPSSLADISGISSEIAKKYKIKSLTLYENAQWLAGTLISKTNPDDYLAFAAKRTDKSWRVVIAPAIEFNQSELNKIPKDISDYLNTFSLNFIGEPEEEGSP